MTTLDTLLLGAIPLLTDEECDRLYAELSEWVPPTREEAIALVAQDVIRGRIAGGDEGMHWVADIVAEIESRPRAYADDIAEKQEPPRACHSKCPADVIEGLPALVERWTARGLPDQLQLPLHITLHPGRVTVDCASIWLRRHYSRELNAATDMLEGITYRHLPHACLCAAFAACVVLGRKG